jgi:hypothetical protein
MKSTELNQANDEATSILPVAPDGNSFEKGDVYFPSSLNSF